MIETSLSELEQRFERLEDADLLKQPLSELIKHIRILNTRFNATEQKTISFSFFDNILEKLTGKERLVLPYELKKTIDNTLLLLDGRMSVTDYNEYASKLQGHSSTEMNALGIAMFSLAVITVAGAIIASAPIGAVILSTIAVASLLAGSLFYEKSGQSGLSKDVSNVASAYEKRLTTGF